MVNKFVPWLYFKLVVVFFKNNTAGNNGVYILETNQSNLKSILYLGLYNVREKTCIQEFANKESADQSSLISIFVIRFI